MPSVIAITIESYFVNGNMLNSIWTQFDPAPTCNIKRQSLYFGPPW
jgi:hypothetical protein